MEPHASKQPDILPTDPKAAGSAGGANLAGSDVAPRLSRTRLPPPPSITIPPKAPSGTVDGAGPMAGAKVASTPLAPGPRPDISRCSAEFPIVLLPVRIETRFEEGPPAELKVRIYPDEIVADAHEPPLTEVERQVGIAYWKNAWQTGEEKDAWRWAVSQLPAPRAAWVVESMTPTNLSSRPTGEPTFPSTESKTEAWSRAVETRVLPDQWIVLAYRNNAEVHRVSSNPIQSPLALSLSPQTTPGGSVDISGDPSSALKLDAEVAWTVDFAKAEEAGMAVRLPLDAGDLVAGFDRLLVLGVRSSLAPARGAEELERLLASHRYSRGIAFVPQGTATNNTSELPSGYPPADVGGSYSFRIERSGPLADGGSDRARFAKALGVSPALADHFGGLNRWSEQDAAKAMNHALWPATLGYYSEQMLAPLLSREVILSARDHFLEYVRGRGPFPAFRIAETPYGLLPASSLTRWRSRGQANAVGPVDAYLPTILQTVRKFWEAQVPNIPRMGRSGDPDADLTEVLGTEASTQEIRVRHALGGDLQRNLVTFLGADSKAWSAEQAQAARDVMERMGHPEWDPRVLKAVYSARPFVLGFPKVTDLPLSETDPLAPFNYINWVRTTSIDDLKNESVPAGNSKPSALLYQMLRHAALAEYARVAFDILIKHNLAVEEDRREPELVDIVPGTETRPTIWERLAQPVPGLTGADSLGVYLVRTTGAPETAPIEAYRHSLELLERLPTAELERLFTEGLDLCSHRIDAWITSLATKRLTEIRATRPIGSYLGAYGWIEELRQTGPAGVSKRPAMLDRTKSAGPQILGGYVHAPSMNHAAAAAILRNAYLTRAGVEQSPYAINLSSRRVRAANWILEGVRGGQPLGALLGYMFERGLHEGERLGLDRFIEPFRRMYPLASTNNGGSAGTVAPQNVVDGLELRKAWTGGTNPIDALGTTPSPEERNALEAELKKLDDAVDALADLFTAESVYQTIRGNIAGATASLDTMSRGIRPPDPEIARQPRSATPVLHRVAVVLGGDPLPAGPWRTRSTPRSLAEPYLDAWVGSLLGDPSKICCRVEYPDPSDSEPNRRGEKLVRLADLDIRPVDFLALARGASDVAQASELDLRVVHAALGESADFPEVRIRYTGGADDPSGESTSFSEILEVARAINDMLGGSRPLRALDLLSNEARGLASVNPLDNQSMTRATGARKFLELVCIDLNHSIVRVEQLPADEETDVSDLRKLLLEASLFGIVGAFPSVTKTSGQAFVQERLQQARRSLSELNRRLEAAAAATSPAEIMHAIFGRDFLFLPRFQLGNPAEIESALTYSAPDLAGKSPLWGAGSGVLRKWFMRVARAREPMARWRKLSLYVAALGGPAMEFAPIQLPYIEGARWIGLPYASASETFAAGTISVALHRPGLPNENEPWVGLLLDEWTELIPNRTENTGVSFQYDAPAAEAPQVVLVAVPPATEPTWDLDTLIAIVSETLDLAKFRVVDIDLLGELGQVLPAIYLATNEANQTIATTFSTESLEAASSETPLAGGVGASSVGPQLPTDDSGGKKRPSY